MVGWSVSKGKESLEWNASTIFVMKLRADNQHKVQICAAFFFSSGYVHRLQSYMPFGIFQHWWIFFSISQPQWHFYCLFAFFFFITAYKTFMWNMLFMSLCYESVVKLYRFVDCFKMLKRNSKPISFCSNCL